MPGDQHPFDLPPDAAPGVGEDGAPQGAAPASDPPNQNDDLRSTVESLKPLTIFAEALKDPNVQRRVIDAFTGAGAAPRDASAPAAPVGPTVADQEKAIRDRFAAQKKAAIEAGDWAGSMDLASEEGAELGALRSRIAMEAAAAPLVSMTASTTVENWIANKRASSALFKQLEPKFREYLARATPQEMAALASHGKLLDACEVTWQKIAAETYESGYNKNAVAAPPRQEPPPYSTGRPGGSLPAPDTPTDDDKDDDAFRAWAEKNNIKFSLGADGALTGEIK